jgi:hypothetical protein
MRRLQEMDETGDSLFRNTHDFYRDALKAGPQLDLLTINFLHHLQEAYNKFEAREPSETSLFAWSKAMLGITSTNAMMGPALLRNIPDLLPSVWLVERGFFFYVNRVPRMCARKYFRARDHVLAAFTSYFSDERNMQGSVPMIRDREVQLRAKGMTTRDVAAYSYSAYAVSNFAVRVEQPDSFPHGRRT